MAGERVFIALGSNVGDRERHLSFAVGSLARLAGIEVVATSSVYETDPIGLIPQGPYLNGAVEVRSQLEPRALLARQLAIEAQHGRVRGTGRDAPRTLDLDLLLFGDRIVDEPGLTLPHPRLHERAFVLTPLCDLAPDLVHPVIDTRLVELARHATRLAPPGSVRRHGELRIPPDPAELAKEP